MWKKGETDISGKLHSRKDWSRLNCKHRWSESPGLRGDSNGLLHLGTPANGNLRVPLILSLSLWQFQMWGRLKKEVICSWGIYNLQGSCWGRTRGARRPQIFPLSPLSISAWAACPAGARAPAISPEVLSSDGWKGLGHCKVGTEVRSEVKDKLVTSHFCFLPQSPPHQTALYD